MRTVITKDLLAGQVEKLLQKPSFDEVVLSPGAAAGVLRIFGTELTASAAVDKILAAVRAQGDEALLRYTEIIDGVQLTSQSMEVSEAEFIAATNQVSKEMMAAIRQAIDNVRRFHVEQLPKSWLTYREHGAILGQNCIPLERVGVYVPGGTAAYPSSVIMNAVPATVAGVKEIIMAVPPLPDGSVSPNVLVAAREAGVTRVFKMGGAQAIAALAFGTATVPRVDKIT
jgi:histidinol dehydrogenase